MSRVLTRKGVPKKLALLTAVVVLVFAALTHTQHARVYGAANGKIVFSSDGGGSNENIYTINADGSDQQQLTNDSFVDFEPSWSPDGNKIVYIGDPNSDGNYQIYTMNADGSGNAQITNDGALNFEPKWSPDGTKIAFAHAADNSSPSYIYTMNPDGTGMTKLTSNVNGDFAPAWKPDGTKLVYNCSDGTYDQLCVMNPDGTNQTALTGSTIEHDNAAWSLDGTQIAFSASIHPYDFSLDVMNADGTNVHTVTTGNFDNENITWSPDGTKFLYQGFGTGGEQVFYANTDGSGQTGITPETERAFNPDWQPLVADSDGDGIPNNTESGGPNGGDSNGDGISDQYQPQVTGLLNPLTNTYNVVQSTCTSNSSLSITSLSQAYKDAGFNYPEGLLGFTLKCPSPGTTATVTVYYYGLSDSSNLVLRKYNNTTHTYQTIPGVTISAATIGGQALTKATYQITDGGPLDQDGSANGVIVDPIGIAAPAVGAPNTGLGGTASRTNVPYWLLRDRRTTVVL